METKTRDLDRRAFMTRAGLGALATGIGAATALKPGTASAELTSIEKANEQLVLDMCKAIEAVDVQALAPFMADTFEFQLIDGQPIIKGKEAFMGFAGTFFNQYESAEFIVHRSHVIGNLVINERTDNFKAKEGGNDASFHVAGFCVVKNGLIHEWKDYRLPQEPAAEA